MSTTSDSPPAPLTVLTDEEQALKDAIAEFASGEIAPRVRAMEAAGRIDPELVAKYFEMGLMGIQVPGAYGGGDGSLMLATIAVEEISKVDASSAIMVDVQNTLVEFPLLTYGNDAQKAKYLPMLTASTIGAYALSEAGSGSDAFGMTSRATKKGDRWILNGRKLWITNGADANLFIVFATIDPAAGYKGVTAFLVERDFKGFTVGRKEDKLGIRASSTTELLLDDCEVPEENVLGPLGQGYKVAMETLNEGRIGIGAQMIGVAEGALSATVSYVKERKQFGKPIADNQGVQFQIAQAAMELEAARLLVYNAARLKDAGHDIVREGAMAKLFASQVCGTVTSLCVDLFGGYGYTKDYPVEKFYRDAKIGTIYEGTSNMQLLTIAKALLK